MRFSRGDGLGAAEDRLHAGDELTRRERLRHVVVGAELETGDAVRLLVARRQHEDRHRRLGTDATTDLESVDAGQADVEHDETDRVAGELRERLLAGAHPDHAIAVTAEVRPHDGADRLLVLDEQHRPARLSRGQVRSLTLRRHFLGIPVTRTDVAG